MWYIVHVEESEKWGSTAERLCLSSMLNVVVYEFSGRDHEEPFACEGSKIIC
jgi:hypothetical protein